MNGYIPRADGEFDGWQGNFEGYLYDNFAELGVTAEVRSRVRDARLLWDEALSEHHAARRAAAAARQAKVDRRAEYLKLIREVVRSIQASETTTDAQRATLGIHVPDRVATPTVTPTTRPIVQVDFSKRLFHTLSYVDGGTPTRRARPHGTMGVEVWVAISPPGDPPPSGPKALRFIKLSTSTPATVEFSGSDGGKTAHYMLRWLSRRGEAGPWSETASATVGV